MLWHILTYPPILSVLTAAVGFAGRHLIGAARWNKLTGKAEQIMQDPRRTSDPKEAMKEAWADVYSNYIEKAATKLVTNGLNK